MESVGAPSAVIERLAAFVDKGFVETPDAVADPRLEPASARAE